MTTSKSSEVKTKWQSMFRIDALLGIYFCTYIYAFCGLTDGQNIHMMVRSMIKGIFTSSKKEVYFKKQPINRRFYIFTFMPFVT